MLGAPAWDDVLASYAKIFSVILKGYFEAI
jgi:hypothetical protein